MANANKVCKTKEESANEYIAYIQEHKQGVYKAFFKYKGALKPYVKKRLNRIFDGSISDDELDMRVLATLNELFRSIHSHDESKYSMYEFDQYRARFYPCEEDLEQGQEAIRERFDKAWVHHYTHNNHHPEYWLCFDSNIARMSTVAFFEMILDWISVSIVKGTTTKNWWYNSDGGRKEKSTMLPEEDVLLLDEIINDLDL